MPLINNDNSPQDRSRIWFLTFPDEPIEEIEAKLSGAHYLGQQERGSEETELNPDGYLHWGILVLFDNAVRFQALKKKFPKAHLEVPRSKRAVYQYVMKTETATGLKIESANFPHEKFQARKMKSGSRLVEMRDLIEANPDLTYYEFLREDPVLFGGPRAQTAKDLITAVKLSKQAGTSRDVEVCYIYGATGVGKSRFIAETFDRKDVYRITNYQHPFDGYESQDVMVFEEFTGQIPIEEMLTLLDRYWIDLPARYFNRPALYTKAYVLSNIPFFSLYPAAPSSQLDAFRRRFTGGTFEMKPGGELITR